MSGFRVDEMSDEGRFMVLFRSRGMLGEGEHCQVFVCVDLASGAEFAAKVHKRLSLRRLQDTTEMQLNEMLQDRAHPSVIAPVACTSIRGYATGRPGSDADFAEVEQPPCASSAAAPPQRDLAPQ